jgi:hypothetical protein
MEVEGMTDDEPGSSRREAAGDAVRMVLFYSKTFGTQSRR